MVQGEKTKKNKVKQQEKTRKQKMGLSSASSALITSSIDKYINKNESCKTNLKPFEEDFAKSKDVNYFIKQIDIDRELVRLLRKKSVPKSVLPNNDFYTFINYQWMKYTQKNSEKGEDYIVQIDDFRLVQNKVYYELMDIVKKYIKSGKKTEQLTEIKNIYLSGLKLLNDSQARQHLNKFIDFYDDCRNKGQDKDAWFFLGTMNKNEVISHGLPFTFYLNPDDKNPTTFRCNLSPPQLSIIDFNVYIKDGVDESYRSNFRRKFHEYVEQLFTAFFGKNHSFNARDVFDVESEIFEAMDCFSLKEAENYYNPVKSTEALSKYGFNWEEFTKALGFSYVPSFFITGSINYLKCGSELYIKQWKGDKWRTYFIYTYMRQVAQFHQKWCIIPFEFCGNFMRGQDKMVPREIMPVFCLAFSHNTFLTNQYIEHFGNQQSIDYVKTMAEDLKLVFKRKIERNTWLQPKTKAYALQKLNNFKLDVGSPHLLREDPSLSYVPDDIWENFSKIVEWRTNQLTKLEGNPVIDIPIIDWAMYPIKLIGTQAYVVNASYTPTENGIYIPLGYIQKPFVDLDERGIEYNLAHIGFTLGHEMSHALDDLGSQYDHKGRLHDWWTEEDKKVFKRKQNDVVKQYETYAKRDGIVFDASISVGEDLADISGLSICLEYLKDFQDYHDDIVPIKSLSIKAFLIYFAFQMRQKISKKAIRAQLKTNPHPLDKYRTNVPLSRLEIFRDMYNVTNKDGMYWHNTDTIW